MGVEHEQLRKVAMKWLANNQKCSVILSEIVTAAFEIPDAIGWKYGHSITVEVKVSRADLARNKQKYHEQTGHAVGSKRYVLCPKGMATSDDPLLSEEWGLLWFDEGRVRVMREPTQRQTDLQQEVRMLTSALRRIQARDFIYILPNNEEPTPTSPPAAGPRS